MAFKVQTCKVVHAIRSAGVKIKKKFGILTPQSRAISPECDESLQTSGVNETNPLTPYLGESLPSELSRLCEFEFGPPAQSSTLRQINGLPRTPCESGCRRIPSHPRSSPSSHPPLGASPSLTRTMLPRHSESSVTPARTICHQDRSLRTHGT
ncbi:hypothetical protein CDAR_97511 [Caerostris darwini]|uniref:Uncharacterized protein n=1 Tax=Caerostris darwini TaxID=1538125 RepID=A0AAV4PQ90_9ARAC|nr:hypothetical protein CDAR_97511 [Caerostris darwini]